MKVLDIGNKRKGYYLNGLKGRNRQNLRAKICQIVICFLSKCSSIAWAFQSVKKQHCLNFAGSGVGLLYRPYYIGENSRVPSIHHLYGSNMYCRDHKSVIRTDYIHNTHCEKYLSLTRHNILSIFTLDIYIILWYIRIVIEFCTISSSEA